MRRLTGTSVLLIGLAGPAMAQEQATGCARPDTVAFRGHARVTESALRSDVGIDPGSTLSYRTMQRAIKDLYATQQFDHVDISCQVVAARPMLVIAVVERPLLGDVDVRGPKRVSPGTVRDQVDILIGRPVDPAQVARVVARIDSLYESKGYYLADVSAETTHVDAGTKVTFVVDEGRRLAVSGVKVQGNEHIAGKTLVAAMQTRPEGFLWFRKGEFDDDKYASDLTEKLPQEYARHGFIDMQLARDTLIVDRERGKAMVDLTVEEGPRYVVGEFEVNGARRFNDTEIKRFYPFVDRGRTLKETLADATKVIRRGGVKDPDNVFDQKRWEDATQLVRDAYSNEGYIHVQLRPVMERVMGKDSTPTVNLRWDILEGTPAIVNRVDIVGNDITTESCIRDQILMVPGDVFNRELLMRSYQSLSQMQFFETPLPGPETKLDEAGDIDIIFKVQEKKTGNINFGASVGEGTGVGGFIGFDQPNLFGLCKRGELRWQYGKYVNDFNLSYTDPRIRESRLSGTATVYHTQSRFIIGDLGRQTRAGGQLRFGMPVPRSRWTRLFLEYGGESVKYGEGAVTSAAAALCGAGKSCFRSSVGATIDRDTRIDMPFPSQGVHQSLSAQFNGGPLGGTSAFQRFTGELRGYTTLAVFGGKRAGSQPLKVVTGVTTKLGAVFGDPGPFFVYQSFALGGVQYGEQLRGYEEFSISPFGYIGQTGNTRAQTQSFGSAFFTSSAELGLRVSQQLYLSSFFDAGNVWLKPRDFNPTRLFRGAGFGAALVTPLGPLGLDLAYGFDRVDSTGKIAGQWQVHFKFGQFF